MKNLKFGSFPLTNIKPEDRKCIDAYMIKTFSTQLLLTSATGSLGNNPKKYKTPTAILNTLTENDPTRGIANNGNNFQDAIEIQRAFKAFKEIYGIIGSDPFYKGSINFPIYIESNNTNNSKNVTNINYDFLLLTNNLQQKQVLDEITYSDENTLSFLLVKDLLMPELKLITSNKIDENKIKDFRTLFIRFLDFSKEVNKSPIEIFEKLIKSAGKTKLENSSNKEYINNFKINEALKTSFSYTESSDTKKESFLSRKFFKELFEPDGAIADPTKLINLLHSDIKKFITEPEKKVSNDFYSSKIQRKVMFSKIQEYGKLLSVFDSLMSFNKLSLNDMYSDVNSSVNNIKITSDEKDVDIDLNLLLEKINNVYFAQFMDVIKTRVSAYFGYISKNSDVKLSDNSDGYSTKKDDIDELKKELKTAENNVILFKRWIGEEDLLPQVPNVNLSSLLVALEKDPNKLSNKVGNIYINSERLRINDFSNLEVIFSAIKFDNEYLTYGEMYKILNDFTNDKSKLLGYENKYKILQANFNKASMAIQPMNDNYHRQNAIIDSKTKKPMITFDLAYLQKSLVQLHNDTIDFLQGVNSSTQQSNLATLKDLYDSTTFRNLDYESLKNSSILSNEFIKQDLSNVSRDIKEEFHNKTLHSNIDTNSDTFIESADNLVKKAYTEYMVKPIILLLEKESNNDVYHRSENLRMETNPMLRKILTPEGINALKTIIVTEKVLLDFYDTTFYFDSLKYENSLMKNIVQKLNNKENKINRALVRLGLDECPVFIISGNNVILKQPKVLSYTQSAIFKGVPIDDLKRTCKIGSIGTMWDEKLMFDYRMLQKKKIALSIFGKDNNVESVKKIIREIQTKEKDDRVIELEKFISEKESEYDEARSNYPKNSEERKTAKKNLDEAKNNLKRYYERRKERLNYYTKQLAEYERRVQDIKPNGSIIDNINNMNSYNNSNSNNFNNSSSYESPRTPYENEEPKIDVENYSKNNFRF